MVQKINKYLSEKKGFTMVELLIVISILAILMTIALLSMNYKAQVQKARDTKRKNDLNFIKNKLEDYYNDNTGYPSPPGCASGSCCAEIDCQSNILDPYLSKFPCDPQNKKYMYCAEKTKSTWYKIYSYFEYSADKAIQTGGCATGCLVNNNCYLYGVSSSNTSIVTTSFCNGPGVSPTAAPTINPGAIYWACQGQCNVIGDPESRCGVGKEFPQCFENDPSCGGGTCE